MVHSNIPQIDGLTGTINYKRHSTITLGDGLTTCTYSHCKYAMHNGYHIISEVRNVLVTLQKVFRDDAFNQMIPCDLTFIPCIDLVTISHINQGNENIYIHLLSEVLPA